MVSKTYQGDYPIKNKQCQKCSSFEEKAGFNFGIPRYNKCTVHECAVDKTGHCIDFSPIKIKK